jgi:hypothetical protein
MTLAGNTVYPYSSIDANFDPPQFRLDSTFKNLLKNLTSFGVCSGLYAYAGHTRQELMRMLSLRVRN